MPRGPRVVPPRPHAPFGRPVLVLNFFLGCAGSLTSIAAISAGGMPGLPPPVTPHPRPNVVKMTPSMRFRLQSRTNGVTKSVGHEIGSVGKTQATQLAIAGEHVDDSGRVWQKKFPKH